MGKKEIYPQAMVSVGPNSFAVGCKLADSSPTIVQIHVRTEDGEGFKRIEGPDFDDVEEFESEVYEAMENLRRAANMAARAFARVDE